MHYVALATDDDGTVAHDGVVDEPTLAVLAIGVPAAAVRNWEQHGTSMDPAVRSLLRVVDREPDAVLRALAE